MRCASAASGSERNHTPVRSGEERREERKPASGSSWRHGMRIVRSGTTCPHANVGQNKYGAKTEGAVLVASIEEVMEEVGHPEVVVHPPLLLGDREGLAGEDLAR